MIALFGSLEASTGPGGARFEDAARSITRIPDVVRSIPEILANPSANPTRSILVLALLVILAVIAVLSVVLIALRPGKTGQAKAEPSVQSAEAPELAAPQVRSPHSSAIVIPLAVLLVAILWVSMGASSMTRYTCLSCHADNPHTSASGDPHGTLDCVLCHENGGLIQRVTVNPVARIEHIVRGGVLGTKGDGYGRTISSQSCISCHESQIAGTTLDKARSLRMSHKEPLKAGAACVDCHALSSGMVSSATGGMAPCLRCHQGTVASAACSTCHIGDPARAVFDPSKPAGVVARVLVPNPQCGSCHTSQATCDGCHGIRMPHTEQFKAYMHARPAAEDIWDNDGRTCAKCHYAGHRSCSQCHAKFPQHPITFKETHKSMPFASTCDCHKWDEAKTGITFCEICHPTGRAASTPTRSAESTPAN